MATKELLEGQKSFIEKRQGNPYSSPAENQGRYAQEWNSWREGWLTERNKLKELAFKEGEEGFDRGDNRENNPYDVSDDYVDNSNPDDVLDFCPRFSWLAGWESKKLETIELFRENNKQEIEKAIIYIEKLGHEFAANRKPSSLANILRNRHQYFIARKAKLQMIDRLMNSRQSKILDLAHYTIYSGNGPTGWKVWDSLEKNN